MTRRRILLVNPPAWKPGTARLPLSLLSLGAVLGERHDWDLVDGNLERPLERAVLAAIGTGGCDLLAVSVMPGPQVPPALALSKAVRRDHPDLPIVWGGYFPTMYPEVCAPADCVDVVVRGQGEETLLELADRLGEGGRGGLDPSGVAGTTRWADGRVVDERDRPFRSPDHFPRLPLDRLASVEPYLGPTVLGRRTTAYQAAIGCRYRCTFCGVADMFSGTTLLPGVERMREDLTLLRDRHGADSVQFYDHNFFDREATSVPVVEALVDLGLPWWCFARADTLLGFSESTWELLRRSRLRMAYIGAETPDDATLRRMRKGTRAEQTLAVAARCEENGIVPELSFIVGSPEDPDGELERTVRMIRELKRIAPSCEIVLYHYTPSPREGREGLPGGHALPERLEEWAEPRWVAYASHEAAPWLPSRTERRIRDLKTVLYSRYPTTQDVALPGWGRRLLGALAGWRWATGVHLLPFELRAAGRLLRLRRPQAESL